MILLPTPRVTCTWKQGGTSTLRQASSAVMKKRGFSGYGRNMQNFGPGELPIVIPDPDHVFLQVDQSGAEAYIVAMLTPPGGNFRKLFTNRIKPHVYVAMHLFASVWQRRLPAIDMERFLLADIDHLKGLKGWKELEKLIKASDHWPARERYYFIAKCCCHSLNYDATAYSLQMSILTRSEGKVSISVKQADAYWTMYRSLFPEIPKWHTVVHGQLKSTRTLRNLFGYPRYFTGSFNDSQFLKEAYAFIPQSTVGTITNIAFTRLQDHVERTGMDLDLLNNKHDSILVQVPRRRKEIMDAARLLTEVINMEMKSPFGETFNMRSEIQIGRNWGHRSKENPEGLRELVIKDL